MKKARLRALTLLTSSMFFVKISVVEMKKARLRALTHSSEIPHDFCFPVEMKKARLRALTLLFVAIWFIVSKQ